MTGLCLRVQRWPSIYARRVSDNLYNSQEHPGLIPGVLILDMAIEASGSIAACSTALVNLLHAP